MSRGNHLACLLTLPSLGVFIRRLVRGSTSWLEDLAPGVRTIAAEEIRSLDLRIAREIQRGRDTMAGRR